MNAPSFVPGAPRIAYEAAGAGPTVVFMHGIGGNRSNWREQLAALAPEFRAVAWDARGYGDSDDYAGPLAFPDFAADLLRLLDHLDVERAHLVGLSMGGGVALDAALKAPERFASVVLADIGSNSDAPGIARIKAEQWSAQVLDQGIGWFVDEMLRHSFFKYYARQGRRQRCHMAALIRQHTPVGLSHVLGRVLAPRKPLYRRGFALSKLAMPALVVVGRFDYACRKPSRFVVSRAPRARLAELRTGHLTALEDPAGFNALVEGFIGAGAAA